MRASTMDLSIYTPHVIKRLAYIIKPMWRERILPTVYLTYQGRQRTRIYALKAGFFNTSFSGPIDHSHFNSSIHGSI